MALPGPGLGGLDYKARIRPALAETVVYSIPRLNPGLYDHWGEVDMDVNDPRLKLELDLSVSEGRTNQVQAKAKSRYSTKLITKTEQ